MEKSVNLPKEYRGNGNKKRFYPSELLGRKIVSEIDRATTIEGVRDYQVAERLGVTKQSYSVMKNMKGSINMGNVEAIANALGYDVEIRFVKRGGGNE